MYLKKFIYINWGNVPNTECEFGPINLFSGGNGSGKTTAADAIQTVMTAAHDNLFHFNPGQDESSQRGRGGKQVRTLPSYVLGCDDGAYARPEGCDGYLGAVFYPTPGEDAEPFTALIGMRAFIEGGGSQRVARLDDIQFFVLPDICLSLGDLLKEDQAGRYVVPLDRVYASLRNQFGSEQVEKYDKKKSYLCRLYGVMRGKVDAVSEREAVNAARAFSRFMAYKPIKGIDEFVAQEVLEQRDLGEAIRSVSTMLKRIHAMEADARQLREAIDRLALGRATADAYISRWLDWQLTQYGLARRRYSDCQTRYLEAKKQQQALRGQLVANQQAIELSDQRREDLQQQLLDLNTRRLGIPTLREKDQLEKERSAEEKRLHQLVPELLKLSQQLDKNQSSAEQLRKALRQTSIELYLPSMASIEARECLKRVAENDLSLNLHELLNRDWIDISPLEDKLDQALSQQREHSQLAELLFTAPLDGELRLRDVLARECGKRNQSAELSKQKLERAERDIRTLETRSANYPNFVQLALAELHKQLPQADVRVLCDHVEVTEPEWQSAIEGYLGAARFGLIVEPEYEAEAIALVRKLAGPGQKARVIQGDKARRDMQRLGDLPSGSVVEVMSFSHATAEYYLKASYGPVQRVENAEQLRGTRRGITQDCLGSGSYAMFRCDIAEADLVFGQGARERALIARRLELDALVLETESCAQLAQETLQLLFLVDEIKAVQHGDILKAMLATQRRLQALEQQLQQLDLSDGDNLEEELTRQKATAQEQHRQWQTLIDTKANLLAEQKNVDVQCQTLDKDQDQTLAVVDQCEERLSGIESLWPGFEADQRLAEVDADLRPTRHYENQLVEIEAELKTNLHRLQQNALQHNQVCRRADAVSFELNFGDEFGRDNFGQVCELRRQFDSLYNRDKNHILAQRHGELESLRQSFNNAFVTNLCHSVYQSIQDGKKVLEELNSELEHHRFGADRESFRFDWQWVPEFKEYWQFFKAVIDNPSLDEGATLFDMKLEPKYQRVRERLMGMLLDEDEQKALRDLARITDYRNYRRYEIYKQPEGKEPIALSQYGTGSGGQLETPAYIIRSAAITSAFRFNEGRSHLRMVLVDEAFSKMDEHRSREVINYLTESLGLQLLFIMPSSKSGPFLELISNQFVFSKCATAQASGELHSRVVLDRQQCDKDKIRELMANHRRTIRQQASLDFLAEVETEA